MSKYIALLSVMIFIIGCAPSDSDEAGQSSSPTSVSVKTGCYSSSYAGAQAGSIGCGILYSSGNQWVDREASQEYSSLNYFYPLQKQPMMYLFNECAGVKNAISMPSGHILMGYNLLVDTAVKFNTLLPYAGVMAHEWGHQIQFQKQYISASESTARRVELEADAWAGYYLYAAKGWSGQNLQSFLQLLFDLGDFQYNSPGHHGTPNERKYMGAYGMQVADYAIRNSISYNYDELHQIWGRAITVVNKLNGVASEKVILSDSWKEPVLDMGYLDGVLIGERDLSEIRASERAPFTLAPPY